MGINFLPKISPRSDDQRRDDIERRLIQQEAEIGGKLFGAVPKGHARRFFCLDKHTWVWHEEWIENGKRQVITTRYEIRSNTIMKQQGGQPQRPISQEEAENLVSAIKLYQRRVELGYQQMLNGQ